MIKHILKQQAPVLNPKQTLNERKKNLWHWFMRTDGRKNLVSFCGQLDEVIALAQNQNTKQLKD